ncbi:hypothetical protein MNBD_GAMMA05-2592 [hydrothermal vent metagenome]|uniref:Uncharacterized protein n=1 Tax=hydrothermal vent metagenome TaxID=652676 RepID=A0A3B0X459_9ZZZZ
MYMLWYLLGRYQWSDYRVLLKNRTVIIKAIETTSTRGIIKHMPGKSVQGSRRLQFLQIFFIKYSAISGLFLHVLPLPLLLAKA